MADSPPSRGRRDAEETERQEQERALVLVGGRSRAIPGEVRQRVARRGDGEAVAAGGTGAFFDLSIQPTVHNVNIV